MPDLVPESKSERKTRELYSRVFFFNRSSVHKDLKVIFDSLTESRLERGHWSIYHSTPIPESPAEVSDRLIRSREERRQIIEDQNFLFLNQRHLKLKRRADFCERLNRLVFFKCHCDCDNAIDRWIQRHPHHTSSQLLKRIERNCKIRDRIIQNHWRDEEFYVLNPDQDLAPENFHFDRRLKS